MRPTHNAVPPTVIACPDCDLLEKEVSAPSGGAARCRRCGAVLYRNRPEAIERTLAYTVAAAVVYVIANTIPLMSLSVVGRTAGTTILGGVLEMWEQGEQITAAIVAFCTVLAPGLDIAFMLTILLAVRRPPAPRWVGVLLRWSQRIRPWRMVEVMMLGILVALIKIAELARVIPDLGMFAVGALVLLLAAMTVSFEPHEVWARVRWFDDQGRPQAGAAMRL